ncbi:unnamed protein product [Brachionus calyciflorus]|uniref:Transmembrane protein n=1 Tax=Brachionus calyciflorus TaxID=104777 RepID=A0A813QJ47_9BILA|nr:unnamed protein product [Brachionus calyciflorus]
MSSNKLILEIIKFLKEKQIQEAVKKGFKSVSFRTFTLSSFGAMLTFALFGAYNGEKNQKKTKWCLGIYGAIVGEFCYRHYKKSPTHHLTIYRNRHVFSFYQSFFGAVVAVYMFGLCKSLKKEKE